jgi:Sulfotransferase domain/N-terminal domain of galactosyltransferase
LNTRHIAFCTTCKGRALHIKQTLPQNLTDNPGALFVLLDYDSDDDLQHYLWSAHRADIESGRLVFYSYTNGGKWHIAHAKNMAARCAILEGAKILVTLDADNFTGPGLAEFIAQKFGGARCKPELFLYPDFYSITQMPWTEARPRRGFAGRLAVWADIFVKMGGYDEQFKIWGSEDIDMLGRLKRVGYTGQFFNTENLQVVTHGPEVRFKEYPEAAKNEGKWQAKKIDMRTETVVNAGKFGCGTVYRHNGYFEAIPIELAPLPTRIFGIGMQKTGTTSLHEALKILGFDSFHWGAGEAALMWYEMQALGCSKTLEQWYAFSDNPFPLLYEKLDAAYPGSKFILTLRNETAWLASVARLFSYEHNPDRSVWDIYPFSNTIHEALYGQTNFDPQVFLQAYRKHNAAVMEYFKCRPQDLLVMDMDNGAGWCELCPFLDCFIPGIPYPKKNAARLIDCAS